MDDIEYTGSPTYTDYSAGKSNIQTDLRKSNTFCDAIILLEDGGCIPVHRVILCSASEYFYKCVYKHEIQRTIRAYVLRNFCEIATSNDEVLSLSADDLADIIGDDALNAKSEEPVWELCLRWIEHDEQTRVRAIPQLLECVRLGLMSQDYFERRVLNHNYVRLSPEAKPIISTAYKFVSDLDDWANEQDCDVSLLVPRLPYDVLFAIGGWFDGSACTLFETYDIRADRWIEFHLLDPYGPRAYHSAAVIGNRIYCIGGYSGTEYYNKCTMFDVETKKWQEIAPMYYRRCYVSVCTMNGRIYAIGGHDGHNRLRSAEVYCPETNQWSILPNMAMRRSDADACTLNGNIYIAGGFDGSICLRSCEVYNPVKNEWSYIPEMINARSGLKCAAYKDQLYVIGGYNGMSRLCSVEAYNPEGLYWSPMRDMLSPRSNFGIEVIDDTIYVTGGFDGLSTINKVEYFKPEQNEWKHAAGMSHHRSAHAIAKVSNFSNIEDFVYESRLALAAIDTR